MMVQVIVYMVLEVCKSLDLPNDFLDNAYKIRNKYDIKKFSVLESKTSHFNARKVIGLCELCDKKTCHRSSPFSISM